MRIIYIGLLVLTLALISIDFFMQYEKISEYSFHVIETNNRIFRYINSDFDGDGKIELLELNVNHAAYGAFDTQDSSQPWKFHHMDENYIKDLFAFDIDDDGKAEIFESMKDLWGDSVWINVRDWDNGLICQTEAIYGQNKNDRSKEFPSWDGSIGMVKVFDLDGDGKKEIIADYAGGHDNYPRAIAAFSYPDGSKIWQYDLPTGCRTLDIAYLDFDSYGDIVLTTFSPGNHVTNNGMIDTISYLMRLNYSGDQVWRKEAAPMFESAQMLVDDMDGDQQLELYCRTVIGEAGSEENVYLIEKINPKDGKTLRRYPLMNANSTALMAGYLTNTKIKSLITTFGITILDRDLNPVYDKIMNGHKVFAIEDVNDDGFDEILTYKQDTVFILDNRLDIKSSFAFDKIVAIHNAEIVRLNSNLFFGENGDYIIYLYERKAVEGYLNSAVIKVTYGGLTSWDKLAKAATSYDWYQVVLFAISGFLIGAIFFHSVLERMPQPKTSKIPVAYNNLMTTLTTFSHGQTASSNINRLAFLLKNIPDDEKVLKKFKDNLIESINTFRNYTIRHLNDIITQAQKGKVNELSRRKIERLSSELDGKLGGIIEKDIYELKSKAPEIKTDIPPKIEELKNSIKKIREEIRGKFQTDIVLEIKRLIGSVKPDFAENGVDFSRINISGDIFNKAYFHPIEFSSVMEELLSNAKYAMAENDQKRIRIDIDMNDDIEIRIIDSGIGISRENIERVFNRGYSTKPGSSGYGLHFVRDTVMKYGGSITVEKSEPFKETVILIKLQKV